MERPYLYTVGGTYQEAIAFMDGCHMGYLHHHTRTEPSENTYLRDLQNYQLFRNWLVKRFACESKEAVRIVAQENHDPSSAILDLYRQFKQQAQVAAKVEVTSGHIQNSRDVDPLTEAINQVADHNDTRLDPHLALIQRATLKRHR